LPSKLSTKPLEEIIEDNSMGVDRAYITGGCSMFGGGHRRMTFGAYWDTVYPAKF